MDLRDAIRVRNRLREIGDTQTNIGVVRVPIEGFVRFSIGTIVLFRKEGSSSKYLTVELPQTEDNIMKNSSMGSCVFTRAVSIGVPADRVEEIILE